MKFGWSILLLISTAAFAGGPKYQKPEVMVPQNWQAPAPWQLANPGDSIPKGAWWTLFNDAELNQYEERAITSNQTLKAAVARLAEARSFAQITSADLYPQINGGVSAARQRVSGNRPTLGSIVSPRPDTENTFQVPFNLNYEIDLFGRVRNNVLAANADAVRQVVVPVRNAISFVPRAPRPGRCRARRRSRSRSRASAAGG